jgi:hypothetical protein
LTFQRARLYTPIPTVGTLCINVWFKDETLFALRFACDMFIVSADLSDWKTGDYEMIREYVKPIPR